MLTARARRWLSARLHEEHGQIAWGFVLALLVVFMFFALAFDAGLWFFDHRTAQNQVDAAAHAGALSLVDGDSAATAQAAAAEWLDRNGIPDPTVDQCDGPGGPWWITIEDSDIDGFNDKVTVCQRRSSSVVFGALSGITDAKVSARAAASFFEYPLLYSLMALSGDKCPAFDVSGQGQITISGGATYTESDCTGPQGALGVSGTGQAQLTSAGNDVIGDFDPTDPITPTPTNINTPIGDPFYFLDQPTEVGLPVFTSPVNQNGGGTTTLTPGVYTRNVRISNGTLVLNPGLYVLYEGFTQTGGTVTSNGAEVLLYSTCDPTECDGAVAGNLSFTGGSLNLTGDSDIYNMLFWIDKTSKYNPGGARLSISGTGTVFLSGLTYALTSDCLITGQASIDLELNMSFICDTIDFSGQGNIIIDYDPITAPVTREIAITE